MMRKLLVILIFFATALSVQAQIKVTAAIDTNKILIGDQILLHFYISKPKSITIQATDFNLLLDTVEQIEVLDTYSPKIIQEGNIQKIKQSIRITSFEEGNHIIPPVLFVSNNNIQAYSNKIYLEVKSIEVDTMAQLLPIKDIIEEPMKVSDWLPYVLIPLGIIILLGFLIFFLMKRKSNKETVVVEKKKIILPAHIIALEKIKQLEQQELWQNEKIKPYYSELSYISREYLENRYHINALESVIQEITHDLEHKDINEEQKETLIQMLKTADMVKFAKVKPNEETHQKSLQILTDFIHSTKQIVLPPQNNEENKNEQHTE